MPPRGKIHTTYDDLCEDVNNGYLALRDELRSRLEKRSRRVYWIAIGVIIYFIIIFLLRGD